MKPERLQAELADIEELVAQAAGMVALVAMALHDRVALDQARAVAVAAHRTLDASAARLAAVRGNVPPTS